MSFMEKLKALDNFMSQPAIIITKTIITEDEPREIKRIPAIDTTKRIEKKCYLLE